MSLTIKPLIWHRHDNLPTDVPLWFTQNRELALYEVRDMRGFNPDTPEHERYHVSYHLSRDSGDYPTLEAAQAAAQAHWEAFIRAAVEETP